MAGSPDIPRAETPVTGRRLALVVAVTDYLDGSLRRLRAPAGDGAELRDLLADPDIGGFTVTTVINERAQQVRIAIEEFLADRRPEDLLLLYLSCHGLMDTRRRLYFAARDTLKQRLASSGVESHWVLDQLEDCRARRQVVILDCCFSGAFARGAKGADDLALGERLLGEGRGRVVLTASRSSEYSFEGEPLEGEDAPRGSVFTSALVDGIRSGRADIDGDGHVSVDDAYVYAFEQVRLSGAQQTPQRWLYGAEGSILLARTPTTTTTQAAPAVRSQPLPTALSSPIAPRAPSTEDPGSEKSHDQPRAAPTGMARWRGRPAVLVFAALGTVVTGVVVAGTLLNGDDNGDGNPEGNGNGNLGGGVVTDTFTIEAPWRLLVENATDDDGDEFVECDVLLTQADGPYRRQWREFYGASTFQMQASGTFSYEANDDGCYVIPQPGDGRTQLPVVVEYHAGDSQVFPAGGLLSVEVIDWTGSSSCELRLRAADDGRLLDSKVAVEGEDPVLLEGGAAKHAFVDDPGCSIRLDAAEPAP